MEPVLKLKDICKEYRRGGAPFFAVDHASLEVEPGGYVNIIGRSGSGKSTLLNIAAGMLPPTSGAAELGGVPLTGKDDAELSRIRNDGIGFIPQGAAALPTLTVLENVMLPFCLYPHDGDGCGYARLLLDRFGVADLADAWPGELSGGELRRVLIARALINRPQIVIADEPTSDLDVRSTRDVMEAFAKLNADGTTLLIVSHDLDALKYGKRVYTMSEGRLAEGNRLAP
ncbi:ABC transporter ATP-binding protein [Synergistes jonesii]|uniref:ABC transporter ATP-binding protein n=1 Tax=Synergistes jonesii TaxID=2754 RepID=UPI00248E863D|nr:ABC transporter ATP-binding protein [Synergistes jonesii]